MSQSSWHFGGDLKFRDSACVNLAQYKTQVLLENGEGIFNYRGVELKKAHILPHHKAELNILDPYRREFVENYSEVKRHRFFHHLNSSQALCINLFLPLISEGKLNLFTEYLNLSTHDVLHSQFEKESPIENATRKTSFDFYLQLADSSEVFVEVKYTEDGFGQAVSDAAHCDKFTETYLPLVKKSQFLKASCRDKAVFFRHYQVLRNFVHISPTSLVVFLFPSGNSAVSEEAIYARDHFLTDEGRDRLKIVHLEDFIETLEARCLGGNLDSYYTEMRRKYILSH